MRSVLFVCTANICRSPMAMALFKEKVARQAAGAETDWRIESAGTWALEGEPPASRTVQVLNEKGIALEQHYSRQIHRGMLKSFNLILTMEQGHKEALRIEFPEAAAKVFTLSEMIDAFYDIRDPMGSSLTDFRSTAREIENILDKGFDKINRLAEGGDH